MTRRQRGSDGQIRSEEDVVSALLGFGAEDEASAAATQETDGSAQGGGAAQRAGTGSVEAEAEARTGGTAELVTGFAENRQSLRDKKNFRRSDKIDARLPPMSMSAGVPRRKHFAPDDAGFEQWRKEMGRFTGGFAQAHVSTQTVKNRHGLVGLWGDFCEREGFGKYVEWVQKDSGTLKK